MTDKREILATEKVTYTIEIRGQFYIVENVPARVNKETGECYFSPETVEQLRKTILEKNEKPKRFDKTPVYEFH
jgi:YgiT-type zinc finger domain-containing protein